MAKVKVLVSFIDRYTEENHPVGEVFEASEERIAEVMQTSPDLIEVISEQAPVRERRKKDVD